MPQTLQSEPWMGSWEVSGLVFHGSIRWKAGTVEADSFFYKQLDPSENPVNSLCLPC